MLLKIGFVMAIAITFSVCWAVDRSRSRARREDHARVETFIRELRALPRLWFVVIKPALNDPHAVMIRWTSACRIDRQIIRATSPRRFISTVKAALKNDTGCWNISPVSDGGIMVENETVSHKPSALLQREAA